MYCAKAIPSTKGITTGEKMRTSITSVMEKLSFLVVVSMAAPIPIMYRKIKNIIPKRLRGLTK